MARPRMDTIDHITVKNKTYHFYGYAPDMMRAVSKVGKKLNRAQFINTGINSEVAIYVE